MNEIPLKATPLERRKLRNVINSGGASLSFNENPDGSVFVDVYDVIIESHSYADLFEELAAVMRES